MSNSNTGDGGTSQKDAAPTFKFGAASQSNFGSFTTQNDDKKDDSTDTKTTDTKTTDTKTTTKPAFGSGGFSFAKPTEPKDSDSDKKDAKPSLFDTPAKPKPSLFDTPKDETAKKPMFGGFNQSGSSSNFGFSSFGVKKEDKDKGKEDGNTEEKTDGKSKPSFSFDIKKNNDNNKGDNGESQKPSLFSSTGSDKPAAGGFPKLSSGGFGSSPGFGTTGSGIGSSSGVPASSFSFAAEKEKGKEKDESKPSLSLAGFGSKSEDKKDVKTGFSSGAKKQDDKTADKPTSAFGGSGAMSDKKDETKPASSSFGLDSKKASAPAALNFSLGTKTENKPAVSFSSNPDDKVGEKPKTAGFGSIKLNFGKPAASSFGLGSKTDDKPKPFSLPTGSSNPTPTLFGTNAPSEAPKLPSLGSGFGATSSPAPAPKTGGFSGGFGASSPAPQAGGLGSNASGAFPTAPKPSGLGIGFGSSGPGSSGPGLSGPGSSGFGSSGFGSSVPRAGSAPPGISGSSNDAEKPSLPPTPTASSTAPGQRIALKKNLLFTAIDDTVYYSYITGKEPREKMVSVGFAISNILLNPSGTLLAVVGSENVSVVRINDADVANSSVQNVSKHISASSVRSVLWNPVADPDATLEVLTGDNQVVSLGVSLENSIEKSVFELAEEDDRIDTIGEVVSFTFGHPSEVMGLLTLYLLNEDGDIFCLSPWMPSSALLTRAEIQGILDQAIYLEQTTKVSSGLPPPGISTAKMFKGNLVWCYDLWRQIPLANKDVRYGHEVALKVTKPKAPFGNGKLKFQGPFAVSPYPEELYTETAKQLVTIKSRGIALFAELFESGRVNILMSAGGPVVCSWEPTDHLWGEEDDEEEGSNELGLREMVLLETIDLEGDTVLSQCLHDGLVHSLASDAVTQIDTRNWYRKLAGAYVEQDMQILSQLQNTKLRSSRVGISLEPVYGVSTFTGKLILVGDEVYECDLSISQHGDLSLPATKLEVASSLPETDANFVATNFRRDGVINAVTPEMMYKLNSIKLHPELPRDASFSMSEKLRQHPDMVTVFTSIATHFSEENKKLEAVSVLMERRLNMQTSELRRQLVDLESIQTRFDKLKKHYAGRDMMGSLKQLIARQEDHEKRFDKLLTTLNRSQSHPLSDAERKWHAELGQLRNKLSVFENQTKQAQTQAKQLASFARNADTSFNSADAIQGITRAELSRTSFMLEEEDRVAEQTRKKLELLLHKSQTRLAVLKAKEEK